MPRATESYLQEHGPVLAEMFTLADEIALVHEPSAVVDGNPYRAETQVEVGGYGLDEQLSDKDYAEQVEKFRTMAASSIAALGAVAAFHLVTSDYFDQSRLAESGNYPTVAFVENADATCRYFDFKDRGSNVRIHIAATVLHGTGDDVAVAARMLQVRQLDGVINSLLYVQEVTCANTGSSETHVTHDTWLSSVSVLDDAKLRLERLGAAQNYADLMGIYIQEAIDAPVAEQLAANLLGSYQGTAGYADLKDLVDKVRQEARVKADAAEKAATADALPTTLMLQDYHRILSIARS